MKVKRTASRLHFRRSEAQSASPAVAVLVTRTRGRRISREQSIAALLMSH